MDDKFTKAENLRWTLLMAGSFVLVVAVLAAGFLIGKYT